MWEETNNDQFDFGTKRYLNIPIAARVDLMGDRPAAALNFSPLLFD
jgi:hypothetical protein